MIFNTPPGSFQSIYPDVLINQHAKSQSQRKHYKPTDWGAKWME